MMRDDDEDGMIDPFSFFLFWWIIIPMAIYERISEKIKNYKQHKR